jgi:membrane protein YqaA with SNARE-associated domain
MTTDVKPQPWNPLYQLRRLYDWTLKWADHPYNTRILAFLAAIESIFFPAPVDPLLMAMGITRPSRSFYYALITTLGSVGGAALGYWIGAAFWAATQDFFFTYVFSPEIFTLVQTKFQENDVVAILLASFTPLPFKVFTISAGVASIPLLTLLGASFVGRGARFFLIGGLIYFFGEPIKTFIDRYFNILAIAFGILGTLGYILIPKLMQ